MQTYDSQEEVWSIYLLSLPVNACGRALLSQVTRVKGRFSFTFADASLTRSWYLTCRRMDGCLRWQVTRAMIKSVGKSSFDFAVPWR